MYFYNCRCLTGDSYLLVYSYFFNQLKINILLKINFNVETTVFCKKKIEKNIVGLILFLKMLLGAAVIPSYKARLVQKQDLNFVD